MQAQNWCLIPHRTQTAVCWVKVQFCLTHPPPVLPTLLRLPRSFYCVFALDGFTVCLVNSSVRPIQMLYGVLCVSIRSQGPLTRLSYLMPWKWGQGNIGGAAHMKPQRIVTWQLFTAPLCFMGLCSVFQLIILVLKPTALVSVLLQVWFRRAAGSCFQWETSNKAAERYPLNTNPPTDIFLISWFRPK